MEPFSTTLADVISTVLATGPNPSASPYLTNDERRSEAARVDAIVSRFADAELDVSDRTNGVGRFAPKSLAPPLHRSLGQRLVDADAQTVETVRVSVQWALAVGYSAMIDAEEANLNSNSKIEIRSDRSQAELWNFWVVHFNTGLVGEFLPKDYLSNVRHIGGDALLHELRSAGVAPRFRSGRIRYVGMLYAQIGLLLRMIQTDAISDASFLEKGELQLMNNWPAEEFGLA